MIAGGVSGMVSAQPRISTLDVLRNCDSKPFDRATRDSCSPLVGEHLF